MHVWYANKIINGCINLLLCSVVCNEIQTFVESQYSVIKKKSVKVLDYFIIIIIKDCQTVVF